MTELPAPKKAIPIWTGTVRFSEGKYFELPIGVSVEAPRVYTAVHRAVLRAKAKTAKGKHIAAVSVTLQRQNGVKA